MLVAERHRKIVELVQSEGRIRVAELSKLFQVTEETIRRDLDKLEAEGKVIRTHGGAVAREELPLEVPFEDRKIERIEQKKAIALKAVRLVESGDCISLDASTTAWQMARILPDIPLTVVTNSVKVVMELRNKENIQVISVGGVLVPRSLSFVGPLAERSVEGYHVQKSFLSCQGLHLQYGLSEATEEQARVKEKMIRNCDKTILLIDSSKFGVRAFAPITDLSDIDTIITDDEVDPSIIESLREVQIKVITAEV
ncbi:DeoR/GlpR family DNA-binding transcription regulator [Thermoflavimicrobium dichotomicum]|uniref:DNA-binding transcriptional regulator of sugar metabolism, DeoR/GlpR family n=1 Tax=Thermoflavimicrobium dichotomicum TaxID=46223 RepID=A0A1I3UP12_9BACL|nr:DeoR/GlpR family DNA-binding transcription regulator [Thermoflavimicrobium dichotomicum]SFJ84655.1 DNA-binding transcriptional regulator of sugar metabolism, DeoR/GlpR family [Thermoflavimicrobium dichotomicum]